MFWSSRKTTDLSLRYDNVYVHPTAEVGTDVEIGPFTFAIAEASSAATPNWRRRRPSSAKAWPTWICARNTTCR